MKSTVKFVALVGLLSLLFSGCSKKKVDALETITKKGKFVIGLDASFPPLGFYDNNNQIVGFDIDLAKEVAKRLGVEFEARPINWTEKEKELDQRKVDCIWNGFTITEERKSDFLFSFPYLQNEQVLVVKSDSNINSIQDMNNKIVGAQKDSTAINAIHANTDFCNSITSLMVFDDNIAALKDLEKNLIDAVVLDSVSAEYMIHTTDNNFKIVDNSLAQEDYGIGFKIGDDSLCLRVETILQEMKADGTVTAICVKWFGKDISIIK